LKQIVVKIYRYLACGVFQNGFARVIQPGSEDAIKNLARYIIRASFSADTKHVVVPFS